MDGAELLYQDNYQVGRDLRQLIALRKCCGVVHEDPSTKVPSKVWTLQAFNEGPLLGAGGGGGVFLLEVQYSILKSLISTCVLSYVGSREDWLLDRICESKKDCWDSIRRTSYPYQ